MRPIDWSKHKVWSAEAIIAERAALNALDRPWGAAIEVETKRRIRVALGAYAYEVENHQIMPDAEWDQLAQQINPKLGTCHPVIDEFFATQFSAMTGMWIHHHPELDGIKALYERHYKRSER